MLPDPIPPEVLADAVRAIRMLPAGSSAEQLARAVLTAAAPGGGMFTEWAVEVTSPAGLRGYRQRCRGRQAAHQAAGEARATYPGWYVYPVWRRVTGWFALPGSAEDATEATSA